MFPCALKTLKMIKLYAIVAVLGHSLNNSLKRSSELLLGAITVVLGWNQNATVNLFVSRISEFIKLRVVKREE